jgi:tetratricopeptide (TPR) repeat protein
MNINEWISRLQHPLVWAGFGLFVFALIISLLFTFTRMGMIFLFVVSAFMILAGFLLSIGKIRVIYQKDTLTQETIKDNPDFLLTAGQKAREKGDYTQAQEWLERLLKIRKAEGKNGLDLALALNELALLYDNQGRYEEAEPMYKRSLDIWEKALGTDHPDVATSLNNLAGLYKDQGRYEEAESMYQRALAILKAKFPAGHPDIKQVESNYSIFGLK